VSYGVVAVLVRKKKELKSKKIRKKNERLIFYKYYKTLKEANIQTKIKLNEKRKHEDNT
jgi:hypothetical protein